MQARQPETASYWERRLGEHDGLKGVGWLGLGESFNRWMYRVRARAFAWAVREAAGDRIASLDVLDVGSGTGFYLDRWRRLGAGSVTGSDLTRVAVERLRTRYPRVPVAQLDLTSEGPLPVRGPFGAISAMDVLFHIVEEDAYHRALANLASLLSEGGLLILSENLLSGSTVQGNQQVSRTGAQITAAMEEVRLEPLRVRPMFCLMNTPVDSSSPLLAGWWRLLSTGVSAHDAVGWVAGAVLFPLELALIRTVRRGPSTKLVVCRKR